jgi:hypothetical protein
MDRTLYDYIAAYDQMATIATDVRNWVQEKADRSNYNPNDLMGWCAIAAAELHKRLIQAGFNSEIRMWNDFGCHCYCVVDDHVVDVTATQFDEYKNVPVLITHCKEAEVHMYHRGSLVFATPDELRTYQQKTRWPSQQIAYA